MQNSTQSSGSLQSEKSPYELWQDKENLPVVKGYSVDVRSVPVVPWSRRGGLGVYVDLTGCQDTNGAYVAEIPPRKSLEPEKHLFEELIFVISGHGTTSVWNEGSARETFEWQAGSLFSPPLNTWHQDFNQGDTPARYLAVTSAPLVINLFRNTEFIFGDHFIFKDRYAGQANFFDTHGKDYSGESRFHAFRELVLECNLIPDVRNLKLEDYPKGPGARHARLLLSGNTMGAHVLEFAEGAYMKAHRHSPGAHVLWLKGEGYTLIWREGREKIKVDWHDGTLLVPPAGWFHQHFNTGKGAVTHLALQWENRQYPRIGRMLADIAGALKDGKIHQLDYSEEDPTDRAQWLEALEKKGIRSRMLD